MIFKKDDIIVKASDTELNSYGIIKSIDDNDWDETFSYSIQWYGMKFSMGYPAEQIDPDYILASQEQITEIERPAKELKEFVYFQLNPEDIDFITETKWIQWSRWKASKYNILEMIKLYIRAREYYSHQKKLLDEIKDPFLRASVTRN